MGINRLYWGGSSGSGFLLTLRSTTPVFLLLNIPNIFLSKPLPTKSQKQQNSALETDLAAIGLVSLPWLRSVLYPTHTTVTGSVGWGTSLWRWYTGCPEWPMEIRRPEGWPLWSHSWCGECGGALTMAWQGCWHEKQLCCWLCFTWGLGFCLTYLACLQRNGNVWAQLARLAPLFTCSHKYMHVIYNKTLVSNALTWPVGVSAVCHMLRGAVCRTPTEIGSHSQTKYYYITNSNLVIANLLAKSLL